MNRISINAQLTDDDLGVDLARANVEDIHVAIQSLKERDRRNLLSRTNSRLKGDLAKTEQVRVAAVKLLVACLPESLPSLRSWLINAPGRWRSEVQFSLFCFLDDSQSLALERAVTKAICDFVAKYLHSVPRNTAKAAWMAGDLLGDHWKGKEALTALLNISRNARYFAGRSAAVHGLERRFSSSNHRDQTLIINALEHVASSDRNEKLRYHATRVLKKLIANQRH